MAIKGVFESTNMLSTRGAARIFDCVSDVELENGMFGYIDELANNESVVYNFHPGTKEGKTVVVIDQPAWNYDESLRSNQRKDKFVVSAGTKFRVREVVLNDEFAINKACATTATQPALLANAFLTIDSTGKLVANAVTTADAIFEAKVMRKRIHGATLVTAANTYGYSTELFEAKVTALA